jgi:hypothetical protein
MIGSITIGIRLKNKIKNETDQINKNLVRAFLEFSIEDTGSGIELKD